MGRGTRRMAGVAGIAAAVLAVLLVALQLLLNSAYVQRRAGNLAASAFDGDLRWSRLHFSVIKAFPRIRIELDSVSLTYPHAMFGRFDGRGMPGELRSAGRGKTADTLASVSGISAAVNIWRLFGGTVRLHHLDMTRPRIFLHRYDEQSANTDIFGSGTGDDADSPASGASWIPRVSVGRIRLEDNPYLVYTSLPDTVYADVRCDELFLKADIKLKKNRLSSKVRNARIHAENLLVAGRLPADAFRVAMDSFCLETPRTNLVELGMDARALLLSGKYGRLEVPFELDSRFAFRNSHGGFRVDLHHLDAALAYVPLHAEGHLRLADSCTCVKGRILVDDCHLGEVLDRYGASFRREAGDIRTDAHLSIAVDADGRYSETEWPEVEASLDIPVSRVHYLPKDFDCTVDLGLRAHVSPDKKVSAEVGKLLLHSGGLDFSLRGKGTDLLGEDASLNARVSSMAVLDSLVRLMPEGNGISASGSLDLGLNVDAWLAELRDYDFERTRVDGSLAGDRIRVGKPSDGISAMLDKPEVRLVSGSSGLTLRVDADSVAFIREGLQAEVRGMSNVADIDKIAVDGKMVPRISFSTDDGLLRLRAGDSRIGVAGTHIALEAYSHRRKPSSRRRHLLDSLQRVYPGVSRDSLFTRAFGHRLRDDFSDRDIKVPLDSSVVELLNRWHPGGLVSVERAWVRTPALPLRTTLNSLDIALDDDNASLASFDLSCGSSDVEMTGGFGGFRRFIRGRGPLKFDFAVNSERLNVNELLYAMEKGKTLVAPDTDDDGFLLDSLDSEQRVPDSGMRAFVVPRNLRGSIALKAGRVNWSDLQICPASAVVSVRDRCLKLSDVDVRTNMGDIRLDAFYASKKLDDISAGLDMKLSDMSAYDIIHLMPSVDAMMPALKSFQGKFDCDLSVTTRLDTCMNVLMPTLNGLIRIAGEDLYVKDAGDFRRITRLLMFRNKNIGEIRDLSVDAVIRDSRLEVYPFILGVDRYRLALMGTQHMNGKMRYNVSVIKSILPIQFGINIYGNLDNWRFSLGRSKYRNGRVPSFSADLDTMQVNLADAIRNIFGVGVREAMQMAGMENRRLAAAKAMQDYSDNASDALLGREEFAQLDSLSFSMDMQEQDEAVQAEVDGILAEALDETMRLQQEWEREHPWAVEAVTRAERRRVEREQRRAAAAARRENTQ